MSGCSFEPKGGACCRIPESGSLEGVRPPFQILDFGIADSPCSESGRIRVWSFQNCVQKPDGYSHLFVNAAAPHGAVHSSFDSCGSLMSAGYHRVLHHASPTPVSGSKDTRSRASADFFRRRVRRSRFLRRHIAELYVGYLPNVACSIKGAGCVRCTYSQPPSACQCHVKLEPCLSHQHC